MTDEEDESGGGIIYRQRHTFGDSGKHAIPTPRNIQQTATGLTEFEGDGFEGLKPYPDTLSGREGLRNALNEGEAKVPFETPIGGRRLFL